MKFRMALAALAATMIALALAGCGGGGGGGGGIPSASVPFERSVTEGVKAVDIVENVAAGQVGGMGVGMDVSSQPDGFRDIGSLMENEAQYPCQGRGIGEKKPSSSLAVQGLAIYLAKHFGKQTRTVEEIDETYDGWHWAGSSTYTDTSLHMSVTGTKSGVGSVSLNANGNGSDISASVEAAFTVSIARDDGKLFTSQGSAVVNLTQTTARFTSTSVTHLDGVVVGSSELAGSATFGLNATYIEFTISGQESIVSEDGYWVNIAYNSWKITANADDVSNGEAYGFPASGTITFAASDGFSGTLTLNLDGAWTGVIRNKAGVQVATTTGVSFWTVDYGGVTTDVYF